jgi:hypothetical protein
MVDNGFTCNWWRKAGTITSAEKKLLLNAENLNLHLNQYHQPVPAGHLLATYGSPFGEVSPFISTTAGAVGRDKKRGTNIFFDPFITALRFATNQYRSKGFIFYSYLLTIGKAAIEMEQFSEEVRELHIYRSYSPYQTQGEIMAKIIIPSVQIEMAMEYDGPSAAAALAASAIPAPIYTVTNASYLPPEKYSNIREVLS